MLNPYETLGVDKNATQDEIKKAYRKLSMQYHPDRNATESEEKQKECAEKFKDVNEAYSILSDPDKKSRYDNGGGMGEGFDFGAGPSFWEDMMRYASGEGFDGFHFRKKSRPTEIGSDLRITVKVSLKDVKDGVHKKIRMQKDCTCKHCHGSGSLDNKTETCPTCNGSGMKTEIYRTGFGMTQRSVTCPDCGGSGIHIVNPCPQCNGSGVLKDYEEVEFDIQPGVPAGSVLSFIGKGNAGPHRGTPGRLLVKVEDKEDEDGLTRDENNNLNYVKYVKFTDLIFGADVEIPYIDKKLKIKIKKGTKSGTTLRLKNKGLPFSGNPYVSMDYLITVECDIPDVDTMSDTETRELEKIGNILP